MGVVVLFLSFFFFPLDGKNENINYTKYLSNKSPILLSFEPQQNALCKTKETKTKMKNKFSIYHISKHSFKFFSWLKINVLEFIFTVHCQFNACFICKPEQYLLVQTESRRHRFSSFLCCLIKVIHPHKSVRL